MIITTYSVSFDFFGGLHVNVVIITVVKFICKPVIMCRTHLKLYQYLQHHDSGIHAHISLTDKGTLVVTIVYDNGNSVTLDTLITLIHI